MKRIISLSIILLTAYFSYGQGTPIVHTELPAAGYTVKYIKADSGLVIAFRDTTTGRGTTRPGAMVVRPQDSLFWGFNGHHWERFGKVSNVIPKVDSVTISGDTLFYWINGYSVGALLPNGSNWKFTGNYGICDGCFLGTLDAADLVFKVDNTESGRLTNFGRTQFGFLSEAFWREAAAFGYMALAKTPNSTAIGPRAEAAGDSSTAIGAGASIHVNQGIGLGDTTRALVGIRTGYPEYPLDVRGQVRIKDGTEGAGKVLTSDATGATSWTTVSGTGTVTNVATGYGLSGGAITTTGTIIVDTATLSGKYLRVSDTTSMMGYYLRKADTANIRFRPHAGTNVTLTGTYPDITISASGGGGGGTDNANVGSGFRLIKPSTQDVKTLFGAWGVTYDSTSNTNGITATVDSSVVSSKGYALNLYNVLNGNTKLQGVFNRETGGSQLSKGDTILTDAASENGLHLKVTRPGSASYFASTLSPYALNIYSDDNNKTLIQDGQIQVKGKNPFVNMATTRRGIAIGIDSIMRHGYIDMTDSLDFVLENNSIPFWYSVGRKSDVFPSAYRGAIYLAAIDGDNVIIGDRNIGDFGTTIPNKDSKLAVYGNINNWDSLKQYGQFHAHKNLNVRGVSVGTGLDRDSTNTAVGNLAMNSSTSGSSENTAVGFQSLKSLTSGVYNASLGAYSLLGLTTGIGNTAMGEESMQYITNSWNNTGVGYNTYGSLISGSGNVGIGSGAGWNHQYGDKNIYIYARSTPSTPSIPATSGVITGSSNVFIGGFGGGLGLPSTTNNNVVITDGDGNIRFWDDSTSTRLPRLAGSGTRMVTADASGKLSTQIIPSGGVTSVSAGFGTSFSTITSTGSVAVDSFTMATRAMAKKQIDSIGALISAGGGSSRMSIASHVVGTNANITAAAGTVYALPDATLSTNRTIDVTAINTNGDYFEIDNLETGFTWSFTGATVYLIDGTTTVTSLGVGFYQFRRINGKIKQIN